MAYFLKGTIEIGKGLALGRLTTAEIAAFVPTAPGMVVYDTDLLKPFQWDGVSWTELGSGGGIEDWATATDYVIGDTVFEENRIYRANADNTSTTFNADRADWDVLVTIPAGSAWTASTYYYADDIVVENNVLYRRIAGGTSGATFDSTEEVDWNVLGSTGVIANWASGVYYEIGEVVTQGTRILRRSIAGTSEGAFTNTEAANWVLVASYGTTTFAGTTYYYAGERVSTVSKVVQRITSGISAGTFSNAEAANWSLISYSLSVWTPTTYFYTNQRVLAPITGALIVGSGGFSSATFDAAEVTNRGWALTTNSGNITPYTASVYFFEGDIMSNDGIIYRRTIAGVSGATFDVAEAANWEKVGTSGNSLVKTINDTDSPYTVTNADENIFIDSSAGPVTYNLDISLPEGKLFTMAYTQTANTITIAGTGGATVMSPTTFQQVASFNTPGSTGQQGTTQWFRIGTEFFFNG